MKKEIIEQISSELSSCEQFVDQSFPSVYTKQDVLQLLVKFADTISNFVVEQEEKSDYAITSERLKELEDVLQGAIASKVERLDSEEVVDYDSASFSIGYNNQVEIDTMDCNSDNIMEAVEEVITDVLHDFFAPVEEESNPQEVIFDTPYATEQ
jgi:hypothetical protein